jgi:hypothetical protein
MAIGAMSLPRGVPFLEETGEQRALLSVLREHFNLDFFSHGSGAVTLMCVKWFRTVVGLDAGGDADVRGWCGRPTNPVIHAISVPMRFA